jgi:hypothetical protein
MPVPPTATGVDPSVCFNADPNLWCCLEGQISDPVCTAEGFWRCDGAWPIMPEDGDRCEPGYIANWSTEGPDAPSCDTATVGFGVFLPWGIATRWDPILPSPSPFVDALGNAVDVVLSGTFVSAASGDCVDWTCVRLILNLDGEDMEFESSHVVSDFESLSPGSPIVVRSDRSVLSIEHDSGALVVALAGGMYSEEGPDPWAPWTVGPLTLSIGDVACVGEDIACNWRRIISALHVDWSGGELELAPFESTIVDTAEGRYSIEFEYSTKRVEAYEGPLCASVEPPAIGFKVLRLPD